MLALAFVFVVLNGFFVLSEYALVKSRPTRLQEMAEAGSGGARRVLGILDRLDSYISATQLGITLASLALGWIGEPSFAHLIEPLIQGIGGLSYYVKHIVATALAFAAITFLHTVLGEIVPKAIGIQNAESIAIMCSRPLTLFRGIFKPIVSLLNGAANLVVRLLGFKPPNEKDDSRENSGRCARSEHLANKTHVKDTRE